jgi:hypothetical protein
VRFVPIPQGLELRLQATGLQRGVEVRGRGPVVRQGAAYIALAVHYQEGVRPGWQVLGDAADLAAAAQVLK